MKTCGESFGGIGNDGQPCRRRVVDGPCQSHSDVSLEELAEKKSQFLELYRTGVVSMRAAAAAVKAAPNTVWRWRQTDPEFDKAVGEHVQTADELRLTMVEDAVFNRIIEGKASPAEAIFWLCNRGRHRWRHVQHVHQTNRTIDIDYSLLSDEELTRIEAGVSDEELLQIKVTAELRARVAAGELELPPRPALVS